MVDFNSVLYGFRTGTVTRAKRQHWDTWIEIRYQSDGPYLAINQGPNIFDYWTPNHKDMFACDWTIYYQ